MVSSMGIPLEILLEIMDKKGLVVDWVDFWDESLKGGWKEKTTINKIETAVEEIHGSKYRREVMKRISLHRGER